MTRLTEVGCVAVDSGLLHLGDPLYLCPDEKPYPYSDWERVAERAGTEAENGVFFHQPAYQGLVVSNFGEDGEYPVFVEQDASGRVRRLIIDFTDELPTN